MVTYQVLSHKIKDLVTETEENRSSLIVFVHGTEEAYNNKLAILYQKLVDDIANTQQKYVYGDIFPESRNPAAVYTDIFQNAYVDEYDIYVVSTTSEIVLTILRVFMRRNFFSRVLVVSIENDEIIHCELETDKHNLLTGNFVVRAPKFTRTYEDMISELSG